MNHFWIKSAKFLLGAPPPGTQFSPDPHQESQLSPPLPPPQKYYYAPENHYKLVFGQNANTYTERKAFIFMKHEQENIEHPYV